MTSTVLVSCVCVSAGPRKLSIQSRRGVPRPAAVPARVRLHRGNALVAGRSRALTPSQPLGRRFRYSPRAASRCHAPRPGAARRAQVRVGRLPPGGVRSTRAALFVSWHLFPRPLARAQHLAPSVRSVYHFSLSTGFSFYSTKF